MICLAQSDRIVDLLIKRRLDVGNCRQEQHKIRGSTWCEKVAFARDALYEIRVGAELKEALVEEGEIDRGRHRESSSHTKDAAYCCEEECSKQQLAHGELLCCSACQCADPRCLISFD